MKKNVISVKNLIKNYGSIKAVQGISFDISQGECFGLLGPNGAGKTTTMEILEGILAPTSGEIEIFGFHWYNNSKKIKEKIGVCLQQTSLTDKLEVHETVELFRSFYSAGLDAIKIINELGLIEKKDARVETLSGGQKQRLAVACALVGNPELLFLDEPTAGLDPQSRRLLWDTINNFKKSGRTVVLTTHYMDEAEKLCDATAIIDCGKIIAHGTPKELINSLGAEHIIEISIDGNNGKVFAAEKIKELPAVLSVKKESNNFILTVTEPHIVLPPLLDKIEESGFKLSNLTTRHASLEDVFVALTGRGLRDE